MHVAFSRDQVAKYYVQDAVRDTAEAFLYRLAYLRAAIVVSGRSQPMPQQVRKQITSLVKDLFQR